ncbi:GAF domain-containing protein [Pseudonocardia alni]|uniref:GAF domain-containing protein n=1 Tax=Pseudonocardia alni TaxID=33907 RepID=UPI00331D49DC
MTTPAPAPAQLWLLHHVDRVCRRHLDALLLDIGEHIGVATADAVVIRRLSADARTLLPVVAYHPDPVRGAAVARGAAGRDESATGGLWHRALVERRPLRWHITPGEVPDGALPDQARFLDEWAVRAALAVPLFVDGSPVGGLGLIRFGVDRPFGDDEERLLDSCGHRVAELLALRRRLPEPDEWTPGPAGPP